VVSVWVDETLAKQASLRDSEIMKFSSIAVVNELLTAEALTPALFLRFNKSHYHLHTCYVHGADSSLRS
jgi:hypothetical protein